MKFEHPTQVAVPIIDAVRLVFQEGKSGLIEVAPDPSSGPSDQNLPKRRLFFVDGELHLPSLNALARKLAPHLPLVDGAEAEAARSEVTSVMERVAKLLASWEGSDYSFFEGNHLLPPDLVGPFPTAFLLMEWSVLGKEFGELVSELGGGSARLKTSEKEIPPGLSPILDPVDRALIERLVNPMELNELVADAEDRSHAVRRLAGLRAIGLIRSEVQTSVAHGTVPVPVEVLNRLSERVGKDLEERPLQLDPSEHRARIRDLLADSGGMTHYELFGLDQDADDGEIHDAYDRLARLVHVRHAETIDLAGREQAFWLLFERATDAYLTLSDPNRRSRYNLRIGASLDPRPTRHVRDGESQELASNYYRQGKAYLAEEDFHFAVELLQQAVQADPKPKYYLTLAEAQEKNPNWLRRAAESYRTAIELGANEADTWNALGRVHEKMGQFEQARLQFRAALKRMPGDPEAEAGLARIAALRPDGEAPTPEGGAKGKGLRGLFGRLRRKSSER
ncbi:MAG: tetratricopeptide repeat protein [Acidobacteriota bacterium]